MSNPFPEIPDELVPQIGHALKGWAHLTSAVARQMPGDLRRANRIRRGALQFLNVPKKPRH